MLIEVVSVTRQAELVKYHYIEKTTKLQKEVKRFHLVRL